MQRVLIVDDSRAVNDLLAETLSDANYSCLQAYNGSEALTLFRKELPDAVVLDLHLPRIHGLDVLAQIKRDSPTTVVVVLTGYGSEQTAVRAIKLGADDYLSKPVHGRQLVEALQKCLARAEKTRGAETHDLGGGTVDDELLARAFYHAPAALLCADEGGAIQAVNRAFARLVGRKPRELLGRPLQELVRPDVRGAWVEAVRRDAMTPGGYDGEVFLGGWGGDAVPVNVTAVARPDSAGGLVLSMRDLRRQKALEEQFYESKKLASLGRVVEGVAHEVRNPLISIGGFARKLRRELGEDPRQAQYLDVILSEVQRLERMVQDIETYVRFTSHNRPSFKPVALDELVSEVAESAGRRSAGWQGQIRLGAAGEFPRIYGDQALLRELFEGLVENAFDAMPAGGELSLDFEAEGNWVRVRVTDTGVGIAEEDLEAIFDPFFTSKTSGAGLGLAKAYMIVEEHSGTIEFESQLGKGTACTVSLPIDRRHVPRSIG